MSCRPAATFPDGPVDTQLGDPSRWTAKNGGGANWRATLGLVRWNWALPSGDWQILARQNPTRRDVTAKMGDRLTATLGHIGWNWALPSGEATLGHIGWNWALPSGDPTNFGPSESDVTWLEMGSRLLATLGPVGWNWALPSGEATVGHIGWNWALPSGDWQILAGRISPDCSVRTLACYFTDPANGLLVNIWTCSVRTSLLLHRPC